MTYDEANNLDFATSRKDPNLFLDMPQLAPCRCGGEAIIDVSMALITCNQCGMSFEYRYNRGVIPYHTWQKAAGHLK